MLALSPVAKEARRRRLVSPLLRNDDCTGLNELTTCRATANLEAKLERERRLRGLQLAVDAGEVWGEHTRELEERCAELEAEVAGLDKVISHLHRRKLGGDYVVEGEDSGRKNYL